MNRIPLATLIARTGTKRRTFSVQSYEPLRRDRDALLRIYLRVVRHWEGARGRIVEAYARELPRYAQDEAYFSVTDAIDDLTAAIDSEGSWFTRIFVELRAEIEAWALSVEAWQRGRWRGAVLSATGVDLDTMLYAGDVQQTLEAALEGNLALIKDVNEQQAAKMKEAVFRGLNQRLPARDVGRELQAITGFGRKRANLIASVELQKLATALDRERQFQAGITQFEYRHSAKLHPRPWHKARNGKIYDWATRKQVDGDDVIAADDMPGVPIRCFPSWQPVGINDDIFVAYRRWHSGDLTTLVTETGESLSATPNHPILTNRGWKSIQSLNVGDYVVHPSVEGVHVSDIDVIQRQPSIGDLFEACKAVFASVTTDGLGGDFHGDAAANEKIEIVDIERGLRNEIKSACGEGFANLLLTMSVPMGEIFASLGIREPVLTGDGLSSNAIVSRLRLLESLCWRQISPNDVTGLACATQIYAKLLEAVGDAGTGYAEPVGQALDALAAFVGEDRGVAIKLLSVTCRALDMIAGSPSAPNVEMFGKGATSESDQIASFPKSHAGFELTYYKVESIVTRPWFGHVYNLQTECGWYMAGSTGVVNCGCRAAAHLDLDAMERELDAQGL